MNLFQEASLGEITDHDSEAVVYTTGKRKRVRRNGMKLSCAPHSSRPFAS
jgi:hypothetical protein